MSHIVGVWELGGHLGHLGRFAALVPEFVERGHSVTLVLRDISRVEHLEGLRHASILQAPLWMPKSRSAPAQPVSMPEILQHFGYLSVPGLTGMTRAWRDTLDLLNPDLILCDYAPTALFATRGMSCIRTAIGSGYSIPPQGVSPMPEFRPIPPELRARATNAEKRVTHVVQRVAEELDQPRISDICEIFSADEQFLCTLPELDHYQRSPSARYWDLPTQASAGKNPNWSHSGRARVFAYIKPPGAHFDATIKALRESGCEAEVFAPGISANVLRTLESEHIRISSRPYDLAKTLDTCDAVISHAGHETVLAALLAGRPVLMIPLQMEQYALAKLVEAQRMGEVVSPDALDQLPGALSRTLGEPIIERTKEFGKQNATMAPKAAALNIIKRCEALLRR